MERKIKILHFGKYVDWHLIESEMEKECVSCELKNTCSTSEFINALKTEVFDIILSDNSEELTTVFRLAKEFTPHTAFIMISSQNQNSAVGEQKRGKDIKYIPKTDLKFLAPVINKSLDTINQRHDISCHWG